MGRPRLVHLTSIGQLRAAAGAWDDLWRQSDVTIPTYRAELVAQWVEQFAPGADFHALVVEDGRQWLAALPLVHRRIGRVIRAGTLPLNEWVSRGELLLRADAETDLALDALVTAIGELPWQLLWLDEVMLDADRWRAFRGAISRAAMAAEYRRRFSVGWIEIDRDWEACRKRWSGKHRQAMSRCARRLAQQGELRLRTLSQLAPDEVEPWIRRGFEVEDRSWKGRQGTSVLQSPGMLSFFTRQAAQLAAWGQLELHFLESGGRPVAFAYGMNAKGVYHSCKVGYDPQYAAFTPGQLLRYHMLEAFHTITAGGDPQRRAIDCVGPITDAHRKWKPGTYAVGRVVLAPRKLLGRLALRAYKRLKPAAGPTARI